MRKKKNLKKIKKKNPRKKRGKNYKAYIFTAKRRRMGAESGTESSSNELQDNQEVARERENMG